MPRVLLATGNDEFAGALVRLLTEYDGLELVAVVQDPAEFTAQGPDIEVVVADPDEPAALADPAASHLLLSAPPGAQMLGRVEAALGSVPAGVHLVFLANALEEQHLAVVDLMKASGFRWTIVYPNALMDYVFAPFVRQIGMGVAFGMTGHGRVGFVSLADVVRVLAEVFCGEGHDGQEYVCTGPASLDMPSVVAALSRTIGRELDYIDLPEDELAHLMLQYAGFHDRDELDARVLSHLRAWRDGESDTVTDTVLEVTGLPPVSVEEWFDAHADQFRVKPSLIQKAAHRVISSRYRHRILR